jgi:hypothetical protein
VNKLGQLPDSKDSGSALESVLGLLCKHVRGQPVVTLRVLILYGHVHVAYLCQLQSLAACMLRISYEY